MAESPVAATMNLIEAESPVVGASVQMIVVESPAAVTMNWVEAESPMVVVSS